MFAKSICELKEKGKALDLEDFRNHVAARISVVGKPQLKSVYARAVGRVSGRALRNNRFINAGLQGARITLSSFGRTAHVLWLELTGLFFLVFAVIGGGAAVRAYHNHEAGKGGLQRFWLGVLFAVLFTYFGVTSFMRSRRKS